MLANDMPFADRLSAKNAVLDSKKDIHFIYSFDFNFFLDNLEDSFPLWDTRTLFHASIFPEIGVYFYNQNLRIGSYYVAN